MDIERLVGMYLRDNGVRAVTETPNDKTTGWVRYTMISEPEAANLPVRWVIEPLMQIDVYASASGLNGSQIAEIADVKDTVITLLGEMPKESHEEGVVTATRILTASRSPDTVLEKARQRYIIQARIWAHPHPGS